MPVILSLEVNNVVYFRHAKLDVTQRPMTVISGYNRDSLISNNTSNGAGKSLFWSAFPNLIYEATPLSSGKQRGQARKAMLGEKESTIIVEIAADNGKHYKVVQTPSKMDIYEDGVDLEIRLAKDQRTFLTKIFPITEDEFYSYVYLQSQRNLSFQVDRPSERLHHITDLFNLNVYDKLKSYFTKKLGEIKQTQVEHDVVASALVRSNQMLERLAWSKDDSEELKQATAYIEKTRTLLRKRQVEVERLKAVQANAKRYADAAASLKKVKVKLTEDQIAVHEKLIREQEDYEAAWSQYQQHYSSTKAKLADLGKAVDRESSLAKLERKQDALEEYLSEAASKRKAARTQVEERAELEGRIASCKVPKAYRKKTKEELQAELRHHQNVMEFEDILKDCADGECPTCLQSVDVSKYRSRIEDSRTALVGVQAALKLIALRDELKAIKTIDFDEDAYQSKKEEWNQLEAKEELWTEQHKNFERKTFLETMLSSMEKPTKVSHKLKYDTEQLQEELGKHRQRAKLANIMDTLGHDNYEDVDAQLAEVTKTLTKMENTYARAQKVIITHSARKGEYVTLRRERKTQEAALTALQPVIAQRDLMKSLEKAYSSKGLKVNAANQILAQIESNLNRYSNLIFAEPFKFSVRAKSDGVHCIVDRGNGKTSDISRLSGAESDCFRLLWMWVMLIMAEPGKRTNFVVLDEPDAHMDDTTRALFVERYLPTLRTLVPNVYLITPKDKHVYSDCAYLTVVKHKGESKLIEDSSDEGDRLRVQPARPNTDSPVKRKRSKKKAG